MTLPDSSAITRLQQDRTASWHLSEPALSAEGLLALVEENHLRNFQLWHEEDLARRDDLGPEAVRRAKRAIDRANQQRNDCVERLDQALVAALAPPPSGVPCNSETPGMMIDRLSILALKVYHMEEQAHRPDASPEHRARSASRLAILRVQQADLATAYDELLAAVRAGARSFRVYYQFKMYNDPTLNPQLYQPSPSA